jgi:metal-responsive CopG/Arc/MetJ family transcriptional regulator
MIEKTLKEMGELLNALEDELGEEGTKVSGELIRSFLKKELSERSGKEKVEDVEIIQALFYMVFRKNLSEIEERIAEHYHSLFEIFRKIERQKF